MGSVKRILVTGSEGFIGGHLVKALLNNNYSVIATYLNRTPNSQLFKDISKRRLTISRLNVLNRSNVAEIINLYKPALIIHLAAKTLVTEAYIKPYTTISTNVLGTLNILEEAKKNGAIGIIFSSSDKAYGISNKAYKETHYLKGSYPYDVSKSAADLICQSYSKTFELPVIVTRLGNVYGEWDTNFDRLIPGVSRSILKNEVFEIRSNGKFIRDYIYIDDAISAYKFLIKNFEKLAGENFNISTSDSLTPIKIIKIMENRIATKIRYKILNSAKGEIPYQHLNFSKIKELGWRPRHNFGDTIAKVFKWYQKYVQAR